MIKSHTSPLWVTCFDVYPVLLSGPTQVLYGSLASMWIIYSSLISSHTSPLWVACFGVDHLFFSYRVSHKSSMGRLFRCGSSILLLSGLTQVLYGSLVSVWIIYSSLIMSDTSPLWATCSLLDVYVCVCMCMHVYIKFVQGNHSPCHFTPMGG